MNFLLGVTTEALRANIDWKSPQRAQFDPQFQEEEIAPPATILLTRVNDLSPGVRMLAHVSFVLSQSMRFTDRRTDRRTDRSRLAIHAAR